MYQASSLTALSLALLLGCGNDDKASAGGGTSGSGGMSAGASGSAGAAGSAAGAGATNGVGNAGEAGAGGSGRTDDDLCGQRPGGTVNSVHVLRFETLSAEDPALVLQLERAYSGAGVGESSLYELKALHVAIDGETTCITDAESLEYENTHHNWFDVARGRAEATTFELRAQFVGEVARSMQFEVVGLDAAGSPTLGPIEVIPTGSPYFCTSCWDHLTVSISEVMLNNESAHADEAGDYEPWIEIYNYGSDDVPLAGWSLSDDFAVRRKWTFPDITIPRHQVLVLFADAESEQGELHTNFALSPTSGQLILTDALGRTDGGIVLEPQAADRSLSFSWASGNYAASSPSPGSPPP